MAKEHSFITLDALRGVAAIAVMVYHEGEIQTTGIVGHGYLAVDFFFMLSGFVLSKAYQSRLDDGWSTWTFLKVRVARLYPLYFLGLTLGFLFILSRLPGSKLVITRPHAFILYAVGLLLLPTLPGMGAKSYLTPLNLSLWSLLYEFLANVVHGVFLRRSNWRVLFGIVLASGTLLVYADFRTGSIGVGPTLSEIPFGSARVMFSYVLGMLLYRAWTSGRVRLQVSPMFTGAALFLALAVPRGEHRTPIYDALITFVLFPLLLLVGATSNPSKRMAGFFSQLGIASYAVYVLHLPVEQFCVAAWARAGRAPDVLLGILWPLLTIALALILDRLYDMPVRNFLRDKLLPTPATAITANFRG